MKKSTDQSKIAIGRPRPQQERDGGAAMRAPGGSGTESQLRGLQNLNPSQKRPKPERANPPRELGRPGTRKRTGRTMRGHAPKLDCFTSRDPSVRDKTSFQNYQSQDY